MKDISMGDCAEISKPIYFYPEKLDDFQKYVKTSLSGLKRDKNLENYTLLIRYIIIRHRTFTPFFFLLFIFSHSHTLNIHRCTPHPTSCLLFTPLNSYSVCFIILHTRTSRSLVSYSWNNVLTGGYTVCIFTALMYVQFAFICKYNGYSIKTRDDNNH